MGIALSGLKNAALRASNAASNIVNASSTTADGKKYAGTDVISTPSKDGGVTSTVVNRAAGSEIDFATELASIDVASVSYRFDAKLVKTASDMQKKLIDSIS
jgi:flagellar basal body rod protein FlgC